MDAVVDRAVPDAQPDAAIDAVPDRTVLGQDCRADRDCPDEAECAGDRESFGRDLEPLSFLCQAPSRPLVGSFCDGADDCGRGLCVIAGSCVAPCVNDDDCDEGEACRSVFARTAPAALQPMDGCVPRVDNDAMFDRQAFPGALRGLGLDGFALPPTPAMSTLFAIETSLPANLLILDATTVGGGTELFNLTTFGPNSPAPLNPVNPEASVLTVFAPNGPRGVVDREYEATFQATGRTDLVVTSFYGGGGNILNVDLFYVGGGGLAPSGARGPRQVSQAFQAMEQIYRSIGVRLGAVRQHEVVGGLRDQLQFIDPDGTDELPLLFSLSAGARRSSVSIFLVRSLDDALGTSGGIPGPPAMHGTGSSGVAVAVDGHFDFGFPLGSTFAHEVGHYLGLFHTSEVIGFVLDPLPDTPECRSDDDLNGDGFLEPSECGGLGAENIMFWAATGDAFSADQGSVVVRNPVLE
ncbi:MAG: hypothetical protein AAGF12_08140 [Myxococcota bacterium]